jgi:recombination protein RecA
MSNTSAEKLKALQLTLNTLEKNYGKGIIMKLGDMAVEPMEVIPTGSLGLDLPWVLAACQKEG